jgi:hypothetical protein
MHHAYKVPARGSKQTRFVVSPIGEDGSPELEQADLLLEYIIEPTPQEHGYAALRADKIDSPASSLLRLPASVSKSGFRPSGVQE